MPTSTQACQWCASGTIAAVIRWQSVRGVVFSRALSTPAWSNEKVVAGDSETIKVAIVTWRVDGDPNEALV